MGLAPTMIFDCDRNEWLSQVNTATSNRRFGMTFFTSGTGVNPTYEIDPLDATSGRGVFRCKAPTQGDTSEFGVDVIRSETGDPVATPTQDYGDVWIQYAFRFNVLTTPGSEIMIGRVRDASANIFTFSASGAGLLQIDFSDAHQELSGTSTLVQGKWYKITFHYTKSSGSSDGDFRVYLAEANTAKGLDAATSSEVTACRYQNHNITQDLRTITARCKNENKPAVEFNTWFAWLVWCDAARVTAQSWDADDLYVKHMGIGQLRDPDTTKQAIKIFGHPGRFRHDWVGVADLKAKVYYKASDTWPGDGDGTLTEGSEISLASADWYQGFGQLSSLSEDTEYVAKVALYRSSSPTDIFWPSRILNWRTIDSDGLLHIGFGSCQDQDSGQPYEWYDHAKTEGVGWWFHLGDMIYESGGTTPTGYFGSKAEWWMDHHNACFDRFFDEFTRTTPYSIMPDDHEVENNYDASYRLGYVEASFQGVGINPTGGNGSARAGASVHSPTQGLNKGQVYDTCREAFYIAEAQGFLNQGYDGGAWQSSEYFRVWKFGTLCIAMLDMRSFEDPNGTEPTSDGSNATQWGEGQKAWIENVVIGDAAIKQRLIFSQTAWGDPHVVAHGDLHYYEMALTERDALIDLIDAENPQWTCFLGGDMHIQNVHRRLDSTSRMFEATISPLAKHSAGLDADYIPPSGSKSAGVLMAARGGVDQNDVYRTYGTALIAPSRRRALVRVNDGDDGSAFFSGTFPRKPPNRRPPICIGLGG